jgi:hypothetical protein
VDADIGELMRYGYLLIQCEGDSRGLLTIPQGGVENSYRSRFSTLFAEEGDLPQVLRRFRVISVSETWLSLYSLWDKKGWYQDDSGIPA